MKIWLLIFVLILVPSVCADGVFIPPYWYGDDIGEPVQKGVIVFDGWQEKLVIEATYNGSLSDFAWIIPVPAYPEVDKADAQLFEELRFLTQPKYMRAPSILTTRFLAGQVLSLDGFKEGVDVIEQKQVGIYAISILSADDPQSLLDWLNENEYRLPQRAEPVLEEYIAKGWYFIAMRINLAPSDEKLLASLKSIDSRVTTLEDATDILTEDIVQSIISEIQYDQLESVRTVELEFDPEDEEVVDGGWIYNRNLMPRTLIGKSDYDAAFEAYHGFFLEHMRSVLENGIRLTLQRKYQVPTVYSCEGSENTALQNGEYCSVWYFTKDSPEYLLLKDVDCGSYCSDISPSKERYSATELASVAAYAVVSDNDRIRRYFDVDMGQSPWYQNAGQKIKIATGQVKSKLLDVRNVEKEKVEKELQEDLIVEFQEKTGLSFTSIFRLEEYLVTVALSDFEKKKGFYDSESYILGSLDQSDYNKYKNQFDGSENEATLEKRIREKLNSTIFWKQSTVEKKLSSGRVQPVLITFPTRQPVYPLRISSVNPGETEVLLYVFSDHKVVANLDGFDVEYAKRIEHTDIKTSMYYHYLDQLKSVDKKMVMPAFASTFYYTNELLDGEYYLTKLRADFSSGDMTDDVTFERAKDDRPERKKIYEENFVGKWIAFIFVLLGVACVVFVISLFPRWVMNRMLRGNAGSRWYVSKRRCVVYVAVFFLFAILVSKFYAFSSVMSDILNPFMAIIELFSHVLNALYVSGLLNGLVTFVFGLFMFFALIHVVVVIGMEIVKRIMVLFDRNYKK